MIESEPAILRAESVTMTRCDGESTQTSLHALSLQIAPGSFVQLCGPCDSGRRLLFDLLGWLEVPAAGSVYFGDLTSRSMSPEERGNQRNLSFGFVFEAPYLIPPFSVLENVAMPLFKVSGSNAREARCRTIEVLDFVGLSQELDAVSLHLTTHAQFRCALARALVNLPKVLFVEEPAGSRREDRVALFELAHEAIERFGVTVVWTGGFPIDRLGDRIVELKSGLIVSDSARIESRADAS